MPQFDTHDDVYQARTVYLGPDEYTLPVQLTYAQWGLFLALFVLFGAGTWLILGLGWAVPGGFAAAPATALIWRYVNPDRPARKVIRTALTDWRLDREPAEERLPRFDARRLHITDGSDHHA